jgi:hypothetical protein
LIQQTARRARLDCDAISHICLVRQRTEQLSCWRTILIQQFCWIEMGKAMKNTFTLKNATQSIFVATVMFAAAGAVHAQGSTAKKSDNSASSSGGYTYGKDAARDYAVSQGSGSHIYGKDQSADYAKSQESGSYSYGKDSSSDYSRSQGSSSTGRATGMGSSSSQGSSTSGTSSGSGGY